MIDGIKSVHAKGGKVKMAYGGAMYDMSGHIHSKYGQIIFTPCQNNPWKLFKNAYHFSEDADGFVASVKALKDQHGLDG